MQTNNLLDWNNCIYRYDAKSDKLRVFFGKTEVEMVKNIAPTDARKNLACQLDEKDISGGFPPMSLQSNYDPEVDVLYLQFIDRSHPTAGQFGANDCSSDLFIVVDKNAQKRIFGIEIHCVSNRVATELRSNSY